MMIIILLKKIIQDQSELILKKYQMFLKNQCVQNMTFLKVFQNMMDKIIYIKILFQKVLK